MNLNDHVDIKDTFFTDDEMDSNLKNPEFDLTEKRYLFGSPIPLESKAAILFFGSSNLKAGPKLFGHMHHDLCAFENEVLKVENIKFRIEFVNKELDKTEVVNYEIFEDFMLNFDTIHTKDLYQNLVTATFLFEIRNKLNDNNVYNKRLHLIFMDTVNIDNTDRFVRQFKAVLNKEKIITTKDKTVEKIEAYVKGVSRLLMVGELPNLIQKGANAQDEYLKLRNVLDLMVKIRK